MYKGNLNNDDDLIKKILSRQKQMSRESTAQIQPANTHIYRKKVASEPTMMDKAIMSIDKTYADLMNESLAIEKKMAEDYNKTLEDNDLVGKVLLREFKYGGKTKYEKGDNTEDDGGQMALQTVGNMLKDAPDWFSDDASAQGKSIGSAIGAAGDFLLPGLGQILSPILGGVGQKMGEKSEELEVVRDHYNQVNSNINPYQYQEGGATGQMDGLSYKGPSHANGGIDITKSGLPKPNQKREVEGKEFAFTPRGKNKDFTIIFSDKLTI